MSEDRMQIDLDKVTDDRNTNLPKKSSHPHIRQLGIEAPKDWREVPIGKIGELATSSVDKKSKEDEEVINLVNYMDVYDNYIIDSNIDYMQVTAPESHIERSQVLPGDILFTPSSEEPDDIGNSAVVTEEMENTLHSYHTVRLRPTNEKIQLDIRFSGWLANAPYVAKQFSRRATGSTRYTLTLGDFSNTRVLLPPLEEQRKIASVLYTVDQAIQQTEEIIDQLDRTRVGLTQSLFLDGYRDYDEVVSAHHRNRLPQHPAGWVTKPAQEVMDVTRGAHPRPKSDTSLWGGHIPMIKIGDRNQGDSRTITYTEDTVTEKGSESSKLVDEGTLIVSNAGTVGAARITGMEACIHDHWLILRNYEDQLDTRYLYHFINWNQDFLESLASGSTVLDLSTDDFRLFDITFPEIEEQREIADTLDSIHNQKTKNNEFCTQLRRIKQGLMQDLLSGEVRTHDKPIEIVDEVFAHG